MSPVLIVDDERDFLQTYERLLRRLRYDVVTAERGAEGLRIADTCRPRLVITDLKLPDMDGLAIVRAVSARPNAPPVIVVSGFASADARGAALAAGAAGFLAKPFALSALVALMHDVSEPPNSAGP